MAPDPSNNTSSSDSGHGLDASPEQKRAAIASANRKHDIQQHPPTHQTALSIGDISIPLKTTVLPATDLPPVNRQANSTKAGDSESRDGPMAAFLRATGSALRSGAASLRTVRTLAYASEAGVSFKEVLPKNLYISTWVLSGLYCVADIGVRTQLAPAPSKTRVLVDWTVFHTAASMVVPGLVIHYIRHGAESVFNRFPRLPPRLKVWGPAVTALASVPFVCHPIDEACHWVLDRTVRPQLDRLGPPCADAFANEGHAKKKE